MKHYKTKSKDRKKALNYYYEHRERILAYVKSKYKHKSDGRCKICGKDLSDLPNRAYRFCESCIKDNTKVSRQAQWYRRHKEELKLKRKEAKTKKKKRG